MNPHGAYKETHAFRPRPRPFSAADFATRPIVARPWLVADMIPGAQVSTIDGDGGLGKSTLGLQLCAAAVTGRSWLDQPVQRGPVLYVSAEDDQDEVHRRLHAICVYLSVGLEDLADLHVWPLAESDPALVMAGPNDSLVQTERWGDLITALDQIQPVALVLDSRADVFGGNEVSRAQARAFIGMLRGLAVSRKMAVILLAHPSLSGMASGNGSSGSTHWRNAVRSALYLTRPEEGDAGDLDTRRLEVKKSNYGPGGLSLRLRWSGGAFVVEGKGGAPVDRATAQASVDETFLRLLTTYAAQGRTVSDRPSANFAPTVFSKDAGAKGATKAGLTSAMNRLFAVGQIRVDMVGRPSRQLRQVVRVTEVQA